MFWEDYVVGIAGISGVTSVTTNVLQNVDTTKDPASIPIYANTPLQVYGQVCKQCGLSWRANSSLRKYSKGTVHSQVLSFQSGTKKCFCGAVVMGDWDHFRIGSNVDYRQGEPDKIQNHWLEMRTDLSLDRSGQQPGHSQAARAPRHGVDSEVVYTYNAAHSVLS